MWRLRLEERIVSETCHECSEVSVASVKAAAEEDELCAVAPKYRRCILSRDRLIWPHLASGQATAHSKKAETPRWLLLFFLGPRHAGLCLESCIWLYAHHLLRGSRLQTVFGTQCFVTARAPSSLVKNVLRTTLVWPLVLPV